MMNATLVSQQLLEERDSLQLRLSSALRHNEDLRARLKPVDGSPNVSLSAPAASQGSPDAAPTLTSDSGADVSADGNLQGLANK